MSTPTKSRWNIMGGVVRKASLVLVPTRASTPSIASNDRDNDATSIKGSVRSLPLASPPALIPPKPAPSYPSPIPESPVTYNEASQPVTIAPSPLVQRESLSANPEHVASPVQEYTPPPLVESTAVGPGGFTDEVEDLPQSRPVEDVLPIQADSADRHEPTTIEPVTSTGPGGFDDNDDLPQPQVIKAPSIRSTDSTDNPGPPPTTAAGLGGFFDDSPQHQFTKEPSIYEEDDSNNQKAPSTQPSTVPGTPEPIVTQPLIPTIPASPQFVPAEPLVPTEPVTPTTPIQPAPVETGSYFALPVHQNPSHDPQSSPESGEPASPAQVNNAILPVVGTQEERDLLDVGEPASPAQINNAILPVVGTQEERGLPDVQPATPQNMPQPAVNSDSEYGSEDEVQMPAPEPAVIIPSATPAYIPQFEPYVGQEVWGGTAHQQDGPKGNASSRSRTTSIHSIVATADPFADPMPKITVSHEQGTPQSMPQPPEPYQVEHEDVPQNAIFMPVPPVHEVNPTRSTYSQFNQTPSGTITGGYDINERTPLLAQPSSPKVTSYLQPSAVSQNIVSVSPQSGVPTSSAWPAQATYSGPRLHDFGWIEYQLPDSTVYYVHPTRRVTADIDLRDERKLDNLNAYFGSHRDGASAPVGMELWLIEDGKFATGKAFRPPVRLLVDHRQRMVSFDGASSSSRSSRSSRRNKKAEDDQLDIEYRYWSFMETHPAHTSLPLNARAEALDVLTWAWTDRLLPVPHSAPAPFTQEECQELNSLLRSFEQSEGGLQSVVHTRIVSRILLRVVTWRQQYFRSNKPLPADVAHPANTSVPQRPFRRALLDFIISILCLGIPYFFFERGRQSRIDEEGGIRNPGPMFIVGACACLTAAIILSASVTFISFPGLDNPARVAGFVAILFSTFSMVSTLVAIFRYKADMDHPISHVAGEGLLMLTKRSVIMALPLVFLVYAIISFVTAIVLYSFRGATNDVRGPQPFEDYTKWTVIGVLGGLAGILLTSLFLLKR